MNSAANCLSETPLVFPFRLELPSNPICEFAPFQTRPSTPSEVDSMSTATETQLLTAEEFYDFCHRPENRARQFELERGEIVEMSRPGERHCAVCGNVTYLLGSYVRQRKQGYVCPNDMGLILARGPDTVRGPDVVVYLETRHFDDLEIKYPERLPALVVEVLSPNDKWVRMTRRINTILQRGVQLVWVLDPESRTVTVHQSDRQSMVFDDTEELTGLDVLPDFRCRVAEFFSMPGD
jgi:Uma2 family endonuclease